MATGAGDQYWEQQMLPSVFKHDLLRRYLPIFAGKTGSRAGGVVYLDGYAGRGRYDNGKPASAELILQIAENQAKAGISYRLFFYESNAESCKVLTDVVEEYRARGVDARAKRSEAIEGLETVIASASRLPLFLFLDPCGVGLPFSTLVKALTGPRAAKWPPTEVLLNFSLDAVRRIGGHVKSSASDERILARLDGALDGRWWREHVRQGMTEEAVGAVVDGFMGRLGGATGMEVFPIPVRRMPSQKPVYYLAFGTRSKLGLWHFADSTARATQTWWEELSMREDAKKAAYGQDSLFGDEPIMMGPKLETVENQALPVIAENIARLVARRGPCRVGAYPAEIFGDYLGRVREKTVRAAIKKLNADGRTASDGKGRSVADLVVNPTR